MSGPRTNPPVDPALDASALRIRRNGRALLTVETGGERFDDVSVRRAFPLEVADAFIGLFDAGGEEIGLLESLDGLEEESRTALEDQLALTYFLPVITSISRIGEEYGVVRADVETTRGPRQIEVRGIRSNIRVLSRNRALIEDTDGNRYELRDFHLLPAITREVLGL